MEERARTLVSARVGCARVLATGGRWLLPWVCVLVLSAAIAQAAGQGLAATLLAERQPLAELAPAEVREAQRSAPAGFRWMTIASVDALAAPSSVACLTRVELASADMIEVPMESLDLLVAELCSDISR